MAVWSVASDIAGVAWPISCYRTVTNALLIPAPKKPGMP